MSQQQFPAEGQSPGQSASFNMGSLGSALPDENYPQNYGQQPSQHFPPSASTPAQLYQLQHVSQYPNQTQRPNPQFGQAYPQQYQGMFPHQQQHPQNFPQPGSSPAPQFYQNQGYISHRPVQVPPYYYQQGNYPPQPQPPQYPQPLNNASFSAHSGVVVDSLSPGSSQRNDQSGRSSEPAGQLGGISSGASSPSVPRGPPRKPKQSGHALWVGNLPPATNVVDLKEHFSREATEDILSVFLISKSNCAFINYKTEGSCAAAMTRFHDSRFQGVRLVCRLRRTSANAVPGVPTGPAALTQSPPTTNTVPAGPTLGSAAGVEDSGSSSSASSPPQDKYFIVKSLTVEDLESSVQNGIWATQSHNEENLNKAYEAVESVYLIFSANKSGEYFGYARMTSAINEDPAAAIEFAPQSQTLEDPVLPKAIATTATATAPAGRIIDDSARGTIFWEAESAETEKLVDGEETRSDQSDQEGEAIPPPKAWGKPFKIEWVSTTRLPFYRTRGLRNPWNSNREVKIARDGTELETAIGRRLVAMFHREPQTAAPAMAMQMQSMMGGGYTTNVRPF